jgi:hypothetical protein
MYIHLELLFRPGLPEPGCVVCPGVSRGFGFAGGDGPADAPSSDRRSGRRFGFLRALWVLFATVALVWGGLYGHAVECIGAVIAAMLVDAIAGYLRARKEV